MLYSSIQNEEGDLELHKNILKAWKSGSRKLPNMKIEKGYKIQDGGRLKCHLSWKRYLFTSLLCTSIFTIFPEAV